MINEQEFLGMQTTEASERPPLIPEGEFDAVIMSDGLGLRDFTYKSGDRQGQKGHRMTVKWEIMDKSLKADLGRTPIITQSIMLNFTEEGGLAAENPGLRALREAVGQNEDGMPWQPNMLLGQTAKLLIKHRIDDNGDEQHDVSRVTSMG